MTHTPSRFIGKCQLSINKLALGTVQIGYDPAVSFNQAKDITAIHPAITSVVFGVKSENEVNHNISSYTQRVPCEF